MSCCGNYMQPPRRETCRPQDDWSPPCCPMDACTVYRLSYECAGCTAGCRPSPLRAHDNLKVADCPLDSCTTQKMSYACPGPCEPARPVIPCSRNVIGEGPLSCLTTVRHDYGPKPFLKLLPLRPPNQLRPSDAPLEGTSVMTASYQAPCAVPQRSYKPIATYCPPDQPFEKDTVNNMSYVPWPAKKKEHYPWACKGQYRPPCTPLDCASIYSASFVPPGEFC